MICGKCQSEMEYFVNGNCCGWKCTKCGWGLATTNIDPIDADEQLYELIVSMQENYDAKTVKAMSEVSGLNVVKARKALQEGYSFRNLTARETSVVMKKLRSNGIEYSVAPEFQHDI